MYSVCKKLYEAHWRSTSIHSREAQEWRNQIKVLLSKRHGSICVNKAIYEGTSPNTYKARRLLNFDYWQSGSIGDRRELFVLKGYS